MDTENEREVRVYEFSYLLVPSMSEEDAKGKVESLKKLFTENGAQIIAEEEPEYIGLAYTMIHKVNNKNLRINSAYFGWFKFSAESDILEKVMPVIDLDKDIVRHLIIKTVAESTLAPKKLSQKKDAHKRFSSTESSNSVEATDLVDTAEAPEPSEEVEGEEVMAEIGPDDVIEVDSPEEETEA